MKIEGIKADWLWQLALVSVPLPSKNTEYLRDKVRIEPVSGHPLMVATDGCMMTVIHHTEATCEDVPKPFTLLVRGAIKKALTKLGKVGRPKSTVSLDLDGESKPRITVRRDDAINAIISGEDALDLIPPFDDPYPNWKVAIPPPERIARSWKRLVDHEPPTVAAINLELLQKLPRFVDPRIWIQPVTCGGPLPKRSEDATYDVKPVTHYIVREAGLEDRAFTLMSPVWPDATFDPPLDCPIPSCIRTEDGK